MLSKCVVSAPKHGEVWQGVAKDVNNAGLGVDEILQLVIAELARSNS